jgi:pyridoxine kinase
LAILSIQSSVSYGYVGNSIVVPALQARGEDVWRLDTVSYSNHPGYGTFSGYSKKSNEINEELRGLYSLGIMKNCEAVLSGYLGELDSAKSVLHAFKSVRAQNKKVIYILDPVIGDENKVYVKDGILQAFKNTLLPHASIVIPNQYELGWLSDLKIHDYLSLIKGAKKILEKGPKAVIITGNFDDQNIINYAVSSEGVWTTSTPIVKRKFSGTGDLFSALFTSAFLQSMDLSCALNFATEGCKLVIDETQRIQSIELAVVPVLRHLSEMTADIPAKRIA